MTREELLDLLTTAATIGRNEEAVGRFQTRGDIARYLDHRMRDEIDAAFTTVALTPTDLKEVEEALGDAIAYRLGDHDPNLGPSEPDDVEPYRKHKALADRLGLQPWY